MRAILILLIFTFLTMTVPIAAKESSATNEATANADTINAFFVGRVKDSVAFNVTPFGAKETTLNSENNAVFDMLNNAENGDRLSLVVDNAQSPKAIKTVVSLQRHRGFRQIIAFMGVAVVLLLIFGAGVTEWDFLALITGQDKRYSASKFQMAAWFFVLFMFYLTTILMLVYDGWLGYLGKVAIPQNLIILSGLSVLTYGAAKAITVNKVEAAKANSPALLNASGPTQVAAAAITKLNQPGGPMPAEQMAADKVYALKIVGAAGPKLSDLVRNDEGNVDLGNAQALFITLLAIALYLLSGYLFLSSLTIGPDLSLPDVDTALLSIFGIGQGAYLAKKAVSPAGEG